MEYYYKVQINYEAVREIQDDLNELVQSQRSKMKIILQHKDKNNVNQKITKRNLNVEK